MTHTKHWIKQNMFKGSFLEVIEFEKNFKVPVPNSARVDYHILRNNYHILQDKERDFMTPAFTVPVTVYKPVLDVLDIEASTQMPFVECSPIFQPSRIDYFLQEKRKFWPSEALKRVSAIDSIVVTPMHSEFFEYIKFLAENIKYASVTADGSIVPLSFAPVRDYTLEILYLKFAYVNVIGMPFKVESDVFSMVPQPWPSSTESIIKDVFRIVEISDVSFIQGC